MKGCKGFIVSTSRAYGKWETTWQSSRPRVQTGEIATVHQKSHFTQRVEKAQWYNQLIVNSGQHHDFNMSDVFFETLEIKKPHPI